MSTSEPESRPPRFTENWGWRIAGDDEALDGPTGLGDLGDAIDSDLNVRYDPDTGQLLVRNAQGQLVVPGMPWQNLPLASGWTAYGSGIAPHFMLEASGFVVLAGGVAKPSAWARGETIANLPNGFRPSVPRYHSCTADTPASSLIATQLVANPDGTVTLGNIVAASGAAIAFLSLDGFRFMASQFEGS